MTSVLRDILVKGRDSVLWIEIIALLQELFYLLSKQIFIIDHSESSHQPRRGIARKTSAQQQQTDALKTRAAQSALPAGTVQL